MQGTGNEGKEKRKGIEKKIKERKGNKWEGKAGGRK